MAESDFHYVSVAQGRIRYTHNAPILLSRAIANDLTNLEAHKGSLSFSRKQSAMEPHKRPQNKNRPRELSRGGSFLQPYKRFL
jgi:hypothetical protein